MGTVMVKHITVIGGGNGGSAAAADLSLRGFKVAWYEVPEFESNIAEAVRRKGIDLEAAPACGLTSGFVEIDTITTDIEQALVNSELVIVIVPAFAQDGIAQLCAQHLRDEHIIVLMPGNFGGAIRFQQVLHECGCNKKFTLAETETLIYGCRKKTPDSISINGYKGELGLAAFPASDTDCVLATFRQLYPAARKLPNVLVAGLSNANFLLHLPVVLGNLSNIENGVDAPFYGHGMTPAIGRIIDAIEAERMTLQTVGIQLRPLLDILKGYYGHQGGAGNTIWEFCRNGSVYARNKMPKTLNHRYLLEDMPYGLIPMLKLLEQVGLPGTHTKSIVDTLCMASGVNLYDAARDLKKLRLDHLSATTLLEFVTVGGRSTNT
jgi:opine dehydrogenase